MKIKSSTTASVVFHVLILFILSFNNQINKTIPPSRSDGISVTLISDEQITKVYKTAPQQNLLIPDNNTPNDINLKNQTNQIKKDPNQLTNFEKKTIIKPNNVKASQALLIEPHKLLNKPLNNKKIQKASPVDELLKQIPSVDKERTGNSNYKAISGNKNGTSNTKNNQINSYASEVIKKIIPYVIIPDGIDSKASAIIEITLLPNLMVYKIKLKQSSGNQEYDDNVQQAILKASPFPPLPPNAKFSSYRVLTLIFRPE